MADWISFSETAALAAVTEHMKMPRSTIINNGILFISSIQPFSSRIPGFGMRLTLIRIYLSQVRIQNLHHLNSGELSPFLFFRFFNFFRFFGLNTGRRGPSM